MGKIEFFTDLVAWQKGHQLVLEVYKDTQTFPATERYGLVSQMRRSVASVTANLAEGFGRRGILDKIRFYDIGIGSIYELQDQLYIAKDVGFLRDDDFRRAIELSKDVQRLVIGLIRSIRGS